MQKAERGVSTEKRERELALHLPHSSLAPVLGFAFGLAQTRDAFARFPLTSLLQQFQALKALEHIPFAAQSGSRAQTPML
jgi:hypothetical protein